MGNCLLAFSKLGNYTIAYEGTQISSRPSSVLTACLVAVAIGQYRQSSIFSNMQTKIQRPFQIPENAF